MCLPFLIDLLKPRISPRHDTNQQSECDCQLELVLLTLPLFALTVLTFVYVSVTVRAAKVEVKELRSRLERLEKAAIADRMR